MTNEMQVKETKYTSDITDYQKSIQGFLIENTDDLRFVTDLEADAKLLRKTIVADFANPKELAHLAHKAICAQESKHLKFVDEFLKQAGSMISDYTMAQKRKEEEERKKLEAIEARKADEERNKLLDQAVKAESAGLAETAQTLFDQAKNHVMNPVIPESTVPKSIETSSGMTNLMCGYDFAITDEREFIQAVAAGKIPLSCVSVGPQIRELTNWVNANNICPPGGAIVLHGVSIKETGKTRSRRK